jgi:hypothetical protein
MSESAVVALVVFTIGPLLLFLWGRMVVRLVRVTAARLNGDPDLSRLDAEFKRAFNSFLLVFWGIVLIAGLIAVFQTLI